MIIRRLLAGALLLLGGCLEPAYAFRGKLVVGGTECGTFRYNKQTKRWRIRDCAPLEALVQPTPTPSPTPSPTPRRPTWRDWPR